MALALAGCALQSGGYFRPVSFTRDQGYYHWPVDRGRLKEVIRVPGVNVDNQYWGQYFEIEIDRAGRPITVRWVSSLSRDLAPSPAMIASATTQIRAWTFAPFQAEGRPIYARFEADFTFVPEQDRPSTHTPFPQITDVNNVVITYSETGIRRASRFLTVHGDGHVDISGSSLTDKNPSQVMISRAEVRSLIEGFRHADFFSLGDNYGGGPSEGTSRTLSITIDGQTKSIREFEGQFGGLPDAVITVEDAVERAAGLDP